MRLVLFYFAILINFFFATISATQNSYLFIGGKDAVNFLKKQPKYIQNGKIQATVGVIPYRNSDGLLEVLLGFETKDKTWSDFGGKFDEKIDTSFLNALEREYFEETGTTKSDIIQLAILDPSTTILYIDKMGKREVIYLIYKVTSEICFTQNAEKTHIQWFELSDFASQRQKEDAKYPLRKYLKEDLLNSDKFDQIVKFLKRQF